MVNIIGHRKINLFMSGSLFVASIVLLAVFGLKTGIDFNGGSLMQVQFIGKTPEISTVKEVVNPLNFGEITVQTAESNALIFKTRFLNETEHQQLLAKLRESFEKDEIKVMETRFETIGAAVSSTLRTRSLYAITAVIIGIILFIAYSFRRVSKPVASWKYGVTAVIALVHDVTITAGVFSVLGHYLGIEVGIPFVVALLTILGYSVNDTIVIFDRIRENLIRRSGANFPEMVNTAINETFARSINTTATTMFTLLALVLFGGETIKYFALALFIGIFLGAYSSIFVASPLLVEWHNWSRRHSS